MEIKHNVYSITSNNGNVYEWIVEDWLKPGKYKFGEVKLVKHLTENDEKECQEIADGIIEEYNNWVYNR